MLIFLYILLTSLPLAVTTSTNSYASTNGTITILDASYGINCNSSLSGALTSTVASYCNDLEKCEYSICICKWDTCPPTPTCINDPASDCAKDLHITWKCTADVPNSNRTLYIPSEADRRIAFLTCGEPLPPLTPRNITVAAFVYDPWTPASQVFSQHGPNWTEWELVRRAEPRFPGHLQPKVPLWGEIDTSLPSTWDLLNTAAMTAGIEVYLWDWYWWPDSPSNPVLVRGLEEGFLNAPTSSNMKWALMWANQDWKDLMPAKRLVEQTVMYHGATNSTIFTQITSYWIEKYFSLPNYLTLAISETEIDCPLVSIYEIDILVQALGGLDLAAAAFANFRVQAASAGHSCIHIQVMGFGARNLVQPIGPTLQTLGVNSVTDYCPQHYQGMPGFPLVDYTSFSNTYISRYTELATQVSPIEYFPNFGVAWDPSPRTVQSDYFDAWGYPATPVLQPTLTEFATAISTSAEAVVNSCIGLPSWRPCLMTVYAYTEFSEGGSLWPTVVDGYGRLEAFTSIFGNRSVM